MRKAETSATVVDETTAAPNMIEVENLVKRYGVKYAVDDISFTIKKGEIVGFLGPNGAGKTTTINIITGFLSCTSGSARIVGLDVLDHPTETKRNIGYLPEQPPLYVDLTVNEYLNFVYDLKGCSFNREAHITDVCNVTKVNDVRPRLIKNLSKGYRQRVAIAQALIVNPPIIILDEPRVGLDPKQVIEIRSLIRTLGRDHTVFLSTHILSEVQSVCDRIIIINHGKIIADKPREDFATAISESRTYLVKICGPQREVSLLLRSRAGVSRVERFPERDGDAYGYLGESEPGVDIRKGLFFALAQNNWPLVGIEPVGEDLEDIFIRLVDQSDIRRKSASARRRRPIITDDANEGVK